MPKKYFYLCLFTTIIAFVVIVMGAYVRLSHAGLGCPDWPGCYGQLFIPQNVSEPHFYPDRPLIVHKAAKEMIHRYLASILGLLILFVALFKTFKRKELKGNTLLPWMLVVIVIFQALLGRWTVTLKLYPYVVMAHLMGGQLVIGVLVWLTLNSYFQIKPESYNFKSSTKKITNAAFIILIIQILLGGWVSSNYAALACSSDFPTCLGSFWPDMKFSEVFTFWGKLGHDYEFGVFSHQARVAIHMIHRIGALMTAIVISFLSLHLFKTELRFLGLIVLSLLSVQLSLGISNVVFTLPLPIAVAHNGVATLLLMAMVVLQHRLTNRAFQK